MDNSRRGDNVAGVELRRPHIPLDLQGELDALASRLDRNVSLDDALGNVIRLPACATPPS